MKRLGVFATVALLSITPAIAQSMAGTGGGAGRYAFAKQEALVKVREGKIDEAQAIIDRCSCFLPLADLVKIVQGER
jgi:hypothetical protein